VKITERSEAIRIRELLLGAAKLSELGFEHSESKAALNKNHPLFIGNTNIPLNLFFNLFHVTNTHNTRRWRSNCNQSVKSITRR